MGLLFLVFVGVYNEVEDIHQVVELASVLDFHGVSVLERDYLLVDVRQHGCVAHDVAALVCYEPRVLQDAVEVERLLLNSCVHHVRQKRKQVVQRLRVLGRIK